MFGAKIKKWIEIVNPRKKSSKSKNGHSGNLGAQQQPPHSANDYKGAVYHSDNGNISSPARRSEVSPIQYHNGRKGWQSPNQETSSTSKIDCPPPVIKANCKSAAGSKTTAYSANSNTIQHNNRTNPTTNYLTTAPTTFYQMKEIDQSMMQSNGNPQVIVTGSKSSTSLASGTTTTTSSSSNNNNHSYAAVSMLHPPPLSYSTSSSNELLLDDAKPKYLISCSSSSSVNSGTVARTQCEPNNNSGAMFKHQQPQPVDVECKYGKIQPINKYISKYRIFGGKSTSADTIDRYNGNSSDDFGTSKVATEAPGLQGGRKSNNNTLGIANGSAIKRNNEINSRNAATMGKLYQRNGGYSISSPLHHQYQQQILQQQQQLPPVRHHLAPPHTAAASSSPSNAAAQSGQSKLGYHVINHVSSPESAYSTGYSTDGNSPGGCSYSPDSYYINIRTGIHYFPKGNANAMDASGGGNRFKSGLKRIEEKHDETQLAHHTHKRTESLDMVKSVTLNAGPQSESQHHRTLSSTSASAPAPPCSPGMSPVLRKNLITATQFRTPSPRQRCRIRTNPWFSSLEPESLAVTAADNLAGSKKRDRDSTGSTTSSSGIKSISDESSEKAQQQQTSKKPVSGLHHHQTDSDSSSSTEKPSKTLVSLTEFKRKFGKKESSTQQQQLPISISTTTQHGESEEDDATLNEIGKFDESYVYEKENDIISDSDRTDCVSDLGQEAGDECESTDDLLDVDFAGSGERAVKAEEEAGGERRKMPSRKSASESQSQSTKKRKKLVRKRNKNVIDGVTRSPLSSRGCRSLGGTPMSIRRSEQRNAEQRYLETTLLSNRSSSLTFNEVHMIRSRMLAISESEKALIKADLEADVKYRQLIHEAESILISMKSNLSPALQPSKDAPPPTVVCSPRRQNVPTNKRVEMLRNCEVDLKRELAKTANRSGGGGGGHESPATIINKRLEILRYETSLSAPSSPKTNRVAPVKTHVTNFIFQNEMQTSVAPKVVAKKPPPPPPPRRFLAPKQQQQNECDTDSESDVKSTTAGHNTENRVRKLELNQPIAQFRSVVCNNIDNDDLFFPQSEPLKRKIYSCNSTIDKIKKSLDFDSELPKKALLQKIQMLRRERQVAKSKENRESSSEAGVSDAVSHDSPKRAIDESIKRKLIMKTIEDIKRSLEDQSLELNELHDSDT